MPGKTFSNILEKGDYNPKKHALVSMEMFERIFHHWVIDIYQQSKHQGINDVPARLWKIGISKYPPALPPKSTELEVLLGNIVWRVISASGVELFGLYYNDLILASVRSNLKKGQKVKIKYDPTDISLVYVYDQHNNRYLPVPAIDQEYTQGLTLWQHQVIIKYAQQNVDDYVDIVHLIAAKQRIKEMIRGASNKLQKSETNIKIGRWINDEQKGRRGEIEHSVAITANDLDQNNFDVRHTSLQSGNSNHPHAGISDLRDEFLSKSNVEDNEVNSLNVDGQVKPITQASPPITSRHRKSKVVSSNKRKGNKNKKPVQRMKEPTSQHDGKLDMAGWDFDYT